MNNAALLELARQWLRAARPAVRVCIARTRGSTPRGAGTVMLVSTDQVAGTIGGGRLEWQALEDARQLLQRAASPRTPAQAAAEADDGSGFLSKHYALGPSLGQCCGGAVELHFEVLHPHLGEAQAANLDWPKDAQRFELALFGAGHVGRAIARALSPLPCKVFWIDERETEFPDWAEAAGNIDRLCVDVVEAEIPTLRPGCRVIICTHSHDLDLRLCARALARDDLPLVGLIGSASKKARFLQRLSAQGLTPAMLARLVCPIGLPGIAGKEPEVIAASVTAQLLLMA